MKSSIAFIAGVAIGTGIGLLVANKVYGRKIRAHINKITKGINKKVKKDKVTNEPTEPKKSDISVGHPETTEKVDTLKTLYNQIVKEESYSKVGKKSGKRIHKIDPDDFANDPAYDARSLRYYPNTDELIDLKTDEHVEIGSTIGYENVKDLATQDPYSVAYYRNEDIMTDFDVEIGDVDE